MTPHSFLPGESDSRVTLETLDSYRTLWHSHREALPCNCPFVLPPWVQSWWTVFGAGGERLIFSVRRGQRVIGMAPLMLQGDTVRFLGDPRLSDYFDCIVEPGRERLFFQALLTHLSAMGMRRVFLGPSPPDSSVMTFFGQNKPFGGMDWFLTEDETFSRVRLPRSWDEFLSGLHGKQRHEVRRKFRRLHETGSVQLRKVSEVERVPQAMDTFLHLFTMNRTNKATFMTGPTVQFFRTLAVALAEEGLLRLFFLEVNGHPVASVFCVDHEGTRYLYNNGYDSRWQQMSVGTLSKLMSLQDAMVEGCEGYNFLKGAESYKARLGGHPIPLSCVHAALS